MDTSHAQRIEFPESAEDLAGQLKEASSASRSLSVFGNNSKRLMGGPCLAADVALSTTRLNRVLQYEPNDLTISVEAGMRWADMQNLLGRQGQLVALDPPYSSDATVGGVVASNSSGPLRKLFGTARDLVIGMEFATLDGQRIRTGGMVVKNVAGLDMGKLLIGSFGTLAIMTSLNLRLHTRPEGTDTFLFSSAELGKIMGWRDLVLKGFLRPSAMDIISPIAAARLGYRGYLLAIRAAGSRGVLARYARELSGAERLSGSDDEEMLWSAIRDFPRDFLQRQCGGLILKISTPLGEIDKLLRLVSAPCVSRAGSGITYIFLSSWQSVSPLWSEAQHRGWMIVVEYASPEIRLARTLWLPPASQNEAGFVMMNNVKRMFDPANLLNRSRLYGRI